MITKSFSGFVIITLMAVLFSLSGCKRDVGVLEPVTGYPKDADIFIDQFGPSVQFQSFGDAKLDALEVTFSEKYSGTSSIKITVPSEGNAFGTYAGGAFVSSVGRDLTGYNALTFWAKSSVEAKLSVAGFGNDNTGASKYTTQQTNLALHTIWSKYVIPIPSSAKLTKEKGLFFFAAANLSGSGYNIWFDDIKFEALGTLAHPRLTITSKTVTKVAGDTVRIDNPITTIFNLNGADHQVQSTPSYLTCSSSDSSIAVVDGDGVITAVGAGTAYVTAKLGDVDAAGKVTIISKAAVGPTTIAPTPTIAANKVISLFSSAYTNVPVDSWSASWGNGMVTDTSVAGHNIKLYTKLGFAGIDFSNHQINASLMTHLRMSLWTVYPTAAPATFKIKLVDFGPDGKPGGGDDSEQELSFSATSIPPLVTGSWINFDLPLSNFALSSQSNIAQIIISGDLRTVWLDNLYFYQGTGSGPTIPTVAPPRPTLPAGNVISLLSNAYSNISVETWAATWQYSTTVVTDRTVAGDNVKLYTNLNFAGILMTTPLDASAMTYFHMDIWTPNSTVSPVNFKILLYDFGADGVYGGGDDTQHELTFTATSTPALVTGSWIRFEIPLTSFTGLKNRAHLAQLVISGGLPTVWVDNVYFHK